MRWTEVKEIVRFNEVDEWGMAWYGHYMAWFEVGRMSLLRRFDLLPIQMVELGYIAPVVRLECDYKQPATTGDRIVIRTTVVKPEIAALVFKFQVVDEQRGALLARGETMQVLMTTEKKMIYKLRGEIEKRITKLVDYCLDE